MKVYLLGFLRLIAPLCLSQFLSACSIPLPDIKPGEIPPAAPLSVQEVSAGEQAKIEILRSAPLDQRPGHQARVAKILSRIMKATPSHDHWNFFILNVRDFNAFTTQGNNVYVFSGLLNALPDDEMVAAILAHEIGHSLARHVVKTEEEQINRAISTLVGATIAGIGMSRANPYDYRLKQDALRTGQLFQQLMDSALVYPHSRSQEYQADQIALFLLADAGVNPQKLIDVMNYMASQQNEQAFSSVLNTHPAASDRSEALQRHLPMAQSRYATHFAGKNLNVFSGEELCQFGFSLYMAGKWKEANRVYAAALKKTPHDGLVASMLAITEARLGSGEKAITRASEASSREPKNGGIRYNLACVYAILGRIDAALKSLQRSIELKPLLARGALSDDDLISLRNNPRFNQILAASAATFSVNN